jgi:hypothetical protein
MTKDVMQMVLATIPDISAEEDRLDHEYGIDPTQAIDLFNDRPALERAFEENSHDEELQQRLLGFDEESLLKAEALMYYGRDRDDCTYREKLDYFRGRRDSKAEIVRTIIEKIPACRGYFEEAERKLRK